MDKTIIFSQLSQTVAELTGCTDADAETFLRELFALAAEQLSADGEVEVGGLGRFVITADTVAFVADPGLAEAINAPFAAFEPVELPEEDEEEEAIEIEETPEEASQPEPAPAPSEPVEPDGEAIAEAAEFEEANDAENSESDEPVESPASAESAVGPRPKRSLAGWLIACLGCFAAGVAVGHYLMPYAACSLAAPEPQQAVEEPAPAPAPEPAPVPAPEPVAAPEPEPAPVVTDTITSTRFLTTMARAHYGQMDYWVYIYEANADKLGHPDRLERGTVVVIPPAEKLGLVAGDEAKIQEASRKAIEIYGRFN